MACCSLHVSLITPFVIAMAATTVAASTPTPSAQPSPLPANRRFDYQIGETYDPPTGVEVVSRD